MKPTSFVNTQKQKIQIPSNMYEMKYEARKLKVYKVSDKYMGNIRLHNLLCPLTHPGINVYITLAYYSIKTRHGIFIRKYYSFYTGSTKEWYVNHVVIIKCQKMFLGVRIFLELLHWRSVRYIILKMCSITYQAHSQQISYLRYVITLANMKTQTMSAIQFQINQVFPQLKQTVFRGFSVIAPILWNSIPVRPVGII